MRTREAFLSYCKQIQEKHNKTKSKAVLKYTHVIDVLPTEECFACSYEAFDLLPIGVSHTTEKNEKTLLVSHTLSIGENKNAEGFKKFWKE